MYMLPHKGMNMKRDHPSAQLHSVKHFKIPENTRVIVRQTDSSTKLFQECRLTRKSGEIVEATFREFGGEKFRIKVSLSESTVTLIEPDLTWLNNSNDFPLIVATRVSKMLSAKKSTKELALSRSSMVL
jgi:hypothetical protein